MPARLASPSAGIAPLYPVLSSCRMVRGSSRANWIAGSHPVLSRAVLQHDSAGVSGGILQQDSRAPSAAAAVAASFRRRELSAIRDAMPARFLRLKVSSRSGGGGGTPRHHPHRHGHCHGSCKRIMVVVMPFCGILHLSILEMKCKILTFFFNSMHK